MATKTLHPFCEKEFESFWEENKDKEIRFVDLKTLFQLHYNVKEIISLKTAEFEETQDTEARNEMDMWDLCLDLFHEAFFIGNEAFFREILKTTSKMFDCSKEVLLSTADFFCCKYGGEWNSICSKFK